MSNAERVPVALLIRFGASTEALEAETVLTAVAVTERDNRHLRKGRLPRQSMARWMGMGRKPPGAGHPAPLTLADQLLSAVRVPSIRPPLLSIRPPFLSIFDARLVTDAGGEKRASRSGCQGEQERSCDPLSGDRGEGIFIQSNSRLIDEVLASAARPSESC